MKLFSEKNSQTEQEAYILIMNENEFGTLTDMSENIGQIPDTSDGALENTDEEAKEDDMQTESDAEGASPAENGIESEHQGDAESNGVQCKDREEYDRLIKTRFKELYAEDTQRLINKRFKKYKALEEKVKRLEDEAARYSDIDALIAAEVEKAVAQTEQRMTLYFQKNAGRVGENATSRTGAAASTDVSRLTKSQRAALASRALKGEKISF